MTTTDTEREVKEMFSDIMVKTNENEKSIVNLKIGLGKVETKAKSIENDTQFIRNHMTTVIDKKVDFRVFVLLIGLIGAICTGSYSLYADDKKQNNKDIDALQIDVVILKDDVEDLRDGLKGLEDGQSKIMDKLDAVKKKDNPDKDG